MNIDNLEMSTFKFINCIGKVGDYQCNGITYNHLTVGGREGLLNALMELKPEQIIRLS